VVSALVATAVSLYHLGSHLFFNKNSWKVKGPALMIISMVPVYSICSGVSLVGTMDVNYIAIPLTAFREFYESLVLIAFMQFIAEFWGGTIHLAGILDTDAMVIYNVFPTPAKWANKNLRCILEKVEHYENALLDMRVFPFPRIPGSHYVAWTYVGALQYAWVMWIYNAILLVLWFKGEVDSVEDVDAWLKIVKMGSNLIAMYNLLILFEYLRECKNTRERMGKIRPISKFVCIKLIVIFSLWQENIFSKLAQYNLLPPVRGYYGDWTDPTRMAKGVVNFLVCIEMLLFAWWHRYAYPCDEEWTLDLSKDENLVKRLHDSIEHKPHFLLRHNIFKMTDDVGYLLNNRVRGQIRFVDNMKKAKRDGLDEKIRQELKDDFRHFELDLDREASLTQLQSLLFKTGFAKTWEQAGEMLKEADKDKSGRLGLKELEQLMQG